MFNDVSKKDIEEANDVYDKITVSGSKPSTGDIFVDDKCQIAIRVSLRNKCYTKSFESNVAVKKVEKEDDCNDFVGKDKVDPMVTIETDDKPNTEGWYNQNITIKINVVDKESGPASYMWCSDTTNCTPVALVTEVSAKISTESTTNKVCIEATDNNDKKTTLCSNNYKLDKKEATFRRMTNISRIKNLSLTGHAYGYTINWNTGYSNYTIDSMQMLALNEFNELYYTFIESHSETAAVGILIPETATFKKITNVP